VKKKIALVISWIIILTFLLPLDFAVANETQQVSNTEGTSYRVAQDTTRKKRIRKGRRKMRRMTRRMVRRMVRRMARRQAKQDGMEGLTQNERDVINKKGSHAANKPLYRKLKRLYVKKGNMTSEQADNAIKSMRKQYSQMEPAIEKDALETQINGLESR
jgi:hypothetical protein